MLTLAEYIAEQQRSDTGLLVFSALVLLCCVLLIRVWHVRAVQSAAVYLSRLALPLVTWAISPALAAAALLVQWVINPLIDTRLTNRRGELVHVAGVLFVALVARLPRMGESLWFDEAFTARVGSLPLDMLPGAIAADVHPPLYFTFKWAWAHLAGIDPLVFRLPDLLFGLLTVWLIYRITLTFLSHRVALTAALLCALMPAAIYYSAEARVYALLTTLVLWALYELLSNRRWRFALIVALLPAAHNLGWFYVAVFGLIALFYNRHILRLIIPPLFIAGLLALPNLALALSQSSSMTDGYWLYFSLVQLLWFLLFNLQMWEPYTLLPIVLPYLALLILSLWSARRLRNFTNARIIGALVIGVPVLLIVVSMVWMPLFLYRGMLPVMLLLLIPLAYAAHGPSARYFRPLLAGVTVMALMVSYSTASMIRPDYASMIREGCGGARTIYATSIPAAFVGYANSDRRVVLWPDAQDNGQTLHMSDMAAYGFAPGSPSGFVCVLQFDNPRAFESERVYVTDLLMSYPLVRAIHYQPHRLGRVNLYVVVM